jgi:hypothetical protein
MTCGALTSTTITTNNNTINSGTGEFTCGKINITGSTANSTGLYWNYGYSRIYDDGQFTIASDDYVDVLLKIGPGVTITPALRIFSQNKSTWGRIECGSVYFNGASDHGGVAAFGAGMTFFHNGGYGNNFRFYWNSRAYIIIDGNASFDIGGFPSDYRIKKNTKSLDDSFTIKNLNPVIYDNILTECKDIGLIAHELQEHYPELVTGEKDGPEYQRVNYIGLIPILINETKNLNKKFEELKQNFEDFKNQKCNNCKKEY